MTGRVFVCFVVAIGCGAASAPPEGQVVLHLTTDAPLPPPPGTTAGPDEPIALFERASFEVFPPGQSVPCEGCARDFAIDRELVASGRASIGIVYAPGARGHRVRVRLFRGALDDRVGARPASTIEAVVALPVLATDGVVHITATLRIADLASPRGTLDAPVDPEPGAPDPRRIEVWPGATRVPCPAPPRDGEACVPGGAYWMGDPTLDTLADFGLEGTEERIVRLSPFYVDMHEVTVGDMRASPVVKRDGAGRAIDPKERDASNPDCTFTPIVDTFERRPANCVTWATARAFCQSRGADLPTEAQLEYLAGGLASRPYVWGVDPPACEDAVAERNPDARDDGVSCIALGTGLDDVGKGRRDRLALQGGIVVDVAGSVSELALDVYSDARDGFWVPGTFTDPVGDVASRIPPPAHAMRGGNWFDQRGLMRSAIRQWFDDGTSDSTVGFRCARPAR